MINRDVTVIRPSKRGLVASELNVGDLFIKEDDAQEADLLEYVRCAVCFYDDGDNDVRTVLPFAKNKEELESYDELPYVDADEPVYRVEIVASELRIVM